MLQVGCKLIVLIGPKQKHFGPQSSDYFWKKKAYHTVLIYENVRTRPFPLKIIIISLVKLV